MRTSPILLTLALAAACGRGGAPDRPPPRCEEPHGMENTGCADVSGIVTRRDGAPLAGAAASSAGAVGREGTVLVSDVPLRTDRTGRYSTRIRRIYGRPAVPDTITVWLRVVATRGNDDVVADSVPVRVELSPVGTMAKSAEVPPISLPVP